MREPKTPEPTYGSIDDSYAIAGVHFSEILSSLRCYRVDMSPLRVYALRCQAGEIHDSMRGKNMTATGWTRYAPYAIVVATVFGLMHTADELVGYWDAAKFEGSIDELTIASLTVGVGVRLGMWALWSVVASCHL